MNIVFLDIETTGLDPQVHELLEFGLVTEDGHQLSAFNSHWRKFIAEADSNALRINKFYERIDEGIEWEPDTIADKIAFETSGTVIAGANPHFDQHFLDVWMRKYGYAPAWDYHVLDVPTYAAAIFNDRRSSLSAKGRSKALRPPYRMNNELLDAVGVSRDESLKHTALGDAVLARTLWMKFQPTPEDRPVS